MKYTFNQKTIMSTSVIIEAEDDDELDEIIYSDEFRNWLDMVSDKESEVDLDEDYWLTDKMEESMFKVYNPKP
jgi:hypothetical protein